MPITMTNTRLDDRAWGNRKSIYYDADDVDDEENAKEEEKEALRIQKARTEAMKEEDFIDEFAGSMAALSAKGAKPGIRLGDVSKKGIWITR
jgi:hypothetical protein